VRPNVQFVISRGSFHEELHDLYSSPTIVRVIKSRIMRWAGDVARIGKRRGLYRVLVETCEGKRPRRRWEDNIKMDLQEVGCGGMDWIELAQDRDQVADIFECGNERSGSIKCRKLID
jgi:hypothetical protein